MPYKVFLSSPSDVMPERALCADIVARINTDQPRDAQLELIRWEETYYSATDTFQTQIPRAGECDVVICIFWKALGTELPEEFRREDGTTRTGSEFEFEDAMGAAEASGTGVPDILVYKKMSEIFFSEQDLEREQLQYKSFKQFWQRWFYSEKGHFLAAFHTFETPDGFSTQLEAHLRQWLKNRAEDVTWTSGSPYPGLRSFDVDDAPVFFGRRQEIERLRARLVRAAMADKPFLLVSGPSGSGKSSLVRAGLIPRLSTPGGLAQLGTDMRWAALTPSQIEADPYLGLAKSLFADHALADVLADGDFDNATALAGLLRMGGATALAPLNKALSRRDAADTGLIPSATRLFLLIDQLEEIFKWEPETADAFLTLVSAMVNDTEQRFLVVATMRSDFVHLAAGNQCLSDLIGRGDVKSPDSVETTLDIAPVGAADMRDIIRLPARAAGLEFEFDAENGADLGQLIEDTADPSLLPAVQYLLRELYEQRRDDVLTLDAYHALGGVRGVMAKRGEAVIAGLDQEARSSFDRVIRGLIKFDTPEGPPTARRLNADTFSHQGAEARLIQALVDARLLVTDGRTLRIAHESLLQGWDRLQQLAEQDRRMLGIRDRLLPYTRRYADAATRSERKALLLRGFQLAEARELRSQWAADSLADADADLPHVIAASDTADKRRRVAQVAGAWGLAAVFAAASVGFYYQWNWAEAQRIRAQAAYEIVQSQVALENGQIEVAARHALTGYTLVPTPDNRAVLLDTLIEISPRLQAVYDGPADVAALAFVDNDVIAVADGIGEVQFRSISGQSVRAPVQLDATMPVRHLARLPDSGLVAVLDDASLVSVDASGATRALDGLAADDLVMPGRHAVAITSAPELNVAIVTFGFGLVTGRCGPANAVQACDWQAAQDGPPLTAIALGHDQTVVVSDVYPFEVVAVQGGVATRLAVHEDRVISVDIAESGAWVATGGEAGALDIHNTISGVRRSYEPWRTTVPVVRWSPDGTALALICNEREICITQTAQQPDARFQTLSGHTARITDIAWSPDGTTLASAAADGTLRIWSMMQGQNPRSVLAGAGIALPALAAHPETRALAAGTEDGAVLIWDKAKGAPVRLAPPDSVQGKIDALVWAATDQLVGAFGDSGTLVRWTVGTNSADVIPLGSKFSRVVAVGDGAVAVPLRDGRVVRVARDGRFAPLASPAGVRATPWGAMAHPGGQDLVVSYSDGGFARLPLDASDPSVIFTPEQALAAIGAGSLSASRDGAYFAASQGEKSVGIFAVAGGAPVIEVAVSSPDSRVVAFEPDGDRLAVLGSDGTVHVSAFKDGRVTPVMSFDPIAQRSRAGDMTRRGRAAQWMAWAGPDQLAVSTTAGDVHLISLDESLWARRIEELARQIIQEEQ